MIMIGTETAGLLPITEMMTTTDITRIDPLMIAVILMMTDAGLITMAPVETMEVNMTRDNQIIDQVQVTTATAIALTGIMMTMAATTREEIEIRDI
jgi:predicted thioredoxin/glutaredoxin